MRENSKEKKNIREAYALKKISEEINLDSKLLSTQINDLSNLTRVVNDSIGDSLVGAVQVLELFEWLPKGVYTIKFKIK